MEYVEETDSEMMFWCMIMYQIGDNVIKKPVKTSCDRVSRLFFGYWLLYTLSHIIENNNYTYIECLDDCIN